MENLNSKKFILTILVVLIAGVFVLTGKLTADSWMAFVGSVTIGYMGVNLYAKKLDGSDRTKPEYGKQS